MPVLALPLGLLPLPRGAFQLLRAVHNLLRPFPVSATTSCHEPAILLQCQQQELQPAGFMDVWPLIQSVYQFRFKLILQPALGLQSHSLMHCIDFASGDYENICLPWEYLFYCGKKSDMDIYKQRALEEHLGQQTAHQRHILAYFYSFASWNSSLEP